METRRLYAEISKPLADKIEALAARGNHPTAIVVEEALENWATLADEKSASPRRGIGVSFYDLGCGALGLTTGFLVGYSQSPVVQYVLPLLFALLASAASIFAFKSSAEKESHHAMQLAGKAVVFLTIPFLMAMIYGSLVRTGATISSLIPSLSQTAEASVLGKEAVDLLSTDDAIAILIAHRSLSAIVPNDEDRNLVVRTIITRRINDMKSFPAIEKTVFERATELSVRLDAIAASGNTINEDQSFVKLLTDIDILKEAFSQKNATMRSKLDAAQIGLAALTGSMSETFSAYLRNDPAVSKPLKELVEALRVTPPSNIMADATKEALENIIKNTPVKTSVVGKILPNVAVIGPDDVTGPAGLFGG